MVMDDLLLNPLAAFLVYLGLVGVLYMIGRSLAGKTPSSPLQSSTYTGGERPHQNGALPGYTATFVVALFFAILHIGVLMLGSSDGNPVSVIYLVGLVVTLIALIVR
jgi:NADH:ubiquinone oxidoreductase subunit 3 (subunit A)